MLTLITKTVKLTAAHANHCEIQSRMYVRVPDTGTSYDRSTAGSVLTVVMGASRSGQVSATIRLRSLRNVEVIHRSVLSHEPGSVRCTSLAENAVSRCSGGRVRSKPVAWSVVAYNAPPVPVSITT